MAIILRNGRGAGVLIAAALIAAAPALRASPAASRPADAGKTKRLPRVLLIGDSISIGYTKPTQELLAGKADVRRIPGNGQHTGTGLKMLDKWLGDGQWDVIHFNWGLWDLCYRNPKSKTQGHRDKVNGTLTMTPAQYAKNLTEIVRRLKATKAKLIWATTTPVPDGEAGRIKGDAAKYNAVAAKIMRANGIAIDDLYAHILPKADACASAKGNVHFTPEGYRCLAEKVAASIQDALEEGSGTFTAAMRSARDKLVAQAFDRTAWERIRTGLREAVTGVLTEADRDPNSHLAAGDRALAREQYDLAVRCMKRAVQLDPNRPDSLRSLAIAQVAAKQYGEAVGTYEAILRAAPDDETARFNLAVALSRIRNFRRAEIEYGKLLARRPEAVRPRYNLATLYQAQGRLDDARRAWQEVIRLAPRLPSAHSCLAEVLLDLGHTDQAMKAYAEAAKLQPDQVAAWINLGAAARAAGSLGRAATALGRAAKLAPADADVWRRYGDVMMDLHRSTELREFLRRAVEAWRYSLQLDADQHDLAEKLRLYQSIVTSQPATQPTR